VQTTGTESIDIGRLIRRILESEIPLSEEESRFEAIQQKHANGQSLTVEDQNLILSLARKADEWERDVESSALTDREETLPGC
jgi:hypothetical protein